MINYIQYSIPYNRFDRVSNSTHDTLGNDIKTTLVIIILKKRGRERERKKNEKSKSH